MALVCDQCNGSFVIALTGIPAFSDEDDRPPMTVGWATDDRSRPAKAGGADRSGSDEVGLLLLPGDRRAALVDPVGSMGCCGVPFPRAVRRSWCTSSTSEPWMPALESGFGGSTIGDKWTDACHCMSFACDPILGSTSAD